MKKFCMFFCYAVLASMGPHAHAQPAITLNQYYQECDSIVFEITLSDTAYDGILITQVLHETILITTDTVPYVHSPYEQHIALCSAVPAGLSGEHACVVLCENNGSQTGTSNVEEIDLIPCPTTGIDENKNTWCTVKVINNGVVVTINNDHPATIFIYDLHGKEIATIILYGNQLIPLDLPSGIYSLLIQQGNKTKAFKLSISD